MKIITTIIRLLVGALFIFSGLIKLNDPQGFSYKLDEYFSVFTADVQKKQPHIKSKLQLGKTVLYSDSFDLSGYDAKQVFDVQISNKSTDTTIKLDSVIVLKFLRNGVEVFNQPLKINSPKKLVLSLTSDGNEMLNKQENITFNSVLAINEELNLEEQIRSESFLVGIFSFFKKYALWLAIFVCVFEVILGVNILIGWKPIWTIWLSLLMIIFFTFLTFYSAYFNKVTDCGCFGDAIKLSPWESFSKDLILLVLLLWIYFRRHKIVLFFSKGLTHKILIVFTLFSVGVASYSYFYNPPINFLHWKKGTNVKAAMAVPPGENASDLKEITYVYEHDGKDIEIVYNSESLTFTPTIPAGAKYKSIKGEVIFKKGYKVPIHDFVVNHPEMGDIAGDIIEREGYKVMLLTQELKGFNKGCIPKLNKTLKILKENNIPVWGITSTDLAVTDKFAADNKIPVKFSIAGRDVIRSMCRPNPTLMLMKDSVIIEIWGSRSLPKEKDLDFLRKDK